MVPAADYTRDAGPLRAELCTAREERRYRMVFGTGISNLESVDMFDDLHLHIPAPC